VLREEHPQLSAVEREHPTADGWDRYRLAGIAVVDLSTGQPSTVPTSP
jgi:hypothetical protein